MFLIFCSKSHIGDSHIVTKPEFLNAYIIMHILVDLSITSEEKFPRLGPRIKALILFKIYSGIGWRGLLSSLDLFSHKKLLRMFEFKAILNITYRICPRFSILYSRTRGTSLQIEMFTVLDKGVAWKERISQSSISKIHS